MQASYRPFHVQKSSSRAPSTRAERKVDITSFMKDTFSSTYACQFVPKHSASRQCVLEREDRPHVPLLNSATTYGANFQEKKLQLEKIQNVDLMISTPKLDDRTTYKTQYYPKDLPDNLPHLTGQIPCQ